MDDKSAAESAIRKLEEFYSGLRPEEQEVIGEIVRSSMLRAARAQAERDWLAEGQFILDVVTPDLAPELVSKLGAYVAGQAVARPSQ